MNEPRLTGQDLFANAIALHQAGRLAQAAELYKSILASEPSNAEVLHLLGVLHHQQGEHARAVELIGRAAAIQPKAAVFRVNLAEALRARGQYRSAAASCVAALQLAPDYPEALNNLGLALQGLGRREEAAQQFQQAVKLRPGFASAYNNLGMVLCELGRIDEALMHFRRAVELDPTLATARTNLGQWLLHRQLPAEALVHCQVAAQLCPNHAIMFHNLGNVLWALGRPDEAKAAYRQAIALDPKFVRAHENLGLMLWKTGSLDEAVAPLERAEELEPQNPARCLRLAELQEDRFAWGQAVRWRERALAFEPNLPGPLVALGRALQRDGQLIAAAERYRAALEVAPRFPAALYRVGEVQLELGALDEAQRLFRAALAIDPSHVEALAGLAKLQRGQLPAEDLRSMESLLADAGLSDYSRSRLLFGLAHVLDARGEYAQAAASLRQANALDLAEARRRHRVYVEAEHQEFIGSQIAAFNQAFFARIAGMGSPSRRPVFVFGLPRSGTTLVEQILASHPRVMGAGEIHLAAMSFESIPSVVGSAQPPAACAPRLDRSAIGSIAGKHLEALEKLDGGRFERVVDKMPVNYLYLGILAAVFPNAVFIHCRRDLRDVAVSCWMTDFTSIVWANDLADMASVFCGYRRLMGHWRAVLPVTIHEVDYELVVEDVESQARRLVQVCGLEWDPACLEFHRSQRPVRTASVSQVRQPIYRRSLQRWRNYESELADLFAKLPPS